MSLGLQSCFLHLLGMHWQSFIETGNLVAMARFGFHDPAVVHLGDRVGVMKYPGVMGHDDHGPVGLDRVLSQQFHHAFARFVVERRGRFVAKNQARFVDERASESDPLLLAAGEFVRQSIQAIAQTQLHKHRLRLIDGGAPTDSGGEERNRGVLGRGQRGQQIILLVNESEIFSAKENPLGGGKTA